MFKEYSVHFLFAGFLTVLTGMAFTEQYQAKRFAKLAPSHMLELAQTSGQRDVVILGDSRAASWPVKFFRGRTVINSGIPGDVSQNLLFRLESNALSHKPEWVIFLIGINDIVTASLHNSRSARQQQLEESFENVRQLVDATNAAGSRVILISVTPPWQPDIGRRLLWGDDIDKDVAWFNQQLKNLVSPDTFYIDAPGTFARLGPDWRALIRKDALHYLNEGYQILTAEVLDIMDQANTIHSKAL